MSNFCLPQPSLMSLTRRFHRWLNSTIKAFSSHRITAWFGLTPLRPRACADRGRTIRPPSFAARHRCRVAGGAERSEGSHRTGGIPSPSRRQEDVLGGCTSPEDATSFEEEGRTVSRTEPQAGCIGALALLVSLAPHHGLSGSLAVSTTVGESKDPSAAQRLAQMLDDAFRLAWEPCQTSMSTFASLLEARAPRVVQDHISELMERPDAFYA